MVFSRDFWRSLPKVPFLMSAMGDFFVVWLSVGEEWVLRRLGFAVVIG